MKTFDKKNTLKGNFNTLIKAYPMLKDNLPKEILEQDYVLSAKEDFKGEALSLSPNAIQSKQPEETFSSSGDSDAHESLYRIIPMSPSLLKTSTLSYLINKKRIS